MKEFIIIYYIQPASVWCNPRSISSTWKRRIQTGYLHTNVRLSLHHCRFIKNSVIYEIYD